MSSRVSNREHESEKKIMHVKWKIWSQTKKMDKVFLVFFFIFFCFIVLSLICVHVYVYI